MGFVNAFYVIGNILGQSWESTKERDFNHGLAPALNSILFITVT